MKTHLEYLEPAAALQGAATVLVVGRRDRLLEDDVRELLPTDISAYWPELVDAAKPGDAGAARETFRAGLPARFVATVLPEMCSRHNAPGRPDAVKRLVEKHLGGEGEVAVILALDAPEHAYAAGLAVARGVPDYSRKSGQKRGAERTVRIAPLPRAGAPKPPANSPPRDLATLQVLAEAQRQAARLVDLPPNELNTDVFVDLAREAAARVGADITVIAGEQLAAAGLGGLWGVGKAAVHPPALVVLDHTRGTGKRVTLVGKGIVYDTGGLSLKGKTDMPGMKTDMGGAAAVLSAFVAACQLDTPLRLRCVLCLAENSVGPESTRPDDIITLYSGKTVEVNNTDAEGRLVLGDGVAWAVAQLKSEVIIDLATLTGAQLMATGKRHCAAICNDEGLETLAIAAGKASGDLVWPLPYAPEFFRGEFKSEVADLKNSVKDRMNAQTSCAGQFIAEHLGAEFEGQWLHLDIAGPAVDGERGTGFGVGLLGLLLPRLAADPAR